MPLVVFIINNVSIFQVLALESRRKCSNELSIMGLEVDEKGYGQATGYV